MTWQRNCRLNSVLLFMQCNLHLIDRNAELVFAWRQHFQPWPEVEIQQGDILAAARHCLIAPANSYGFMDGGIDLAYRSFFGPAIEKRVQHSINIRHEGLLPVGAATFVSTGHPNIPYLLVAPTMTLPEAVPALNAMRALRAALRLVVQYPVLAVDVYCPGLATGVGAVPADEAAAAMAQAYREYKGLDHDRGGVDGDVI